MIMLKFPRHAVAALTLCGAVGVACGSKSSDRGDGDENGDGDGDGDGDVVTGAGGSPVVGSGGATASGGNMGTGGNVCAGLTTVGGTEPLIDDFEHAESASIATVDGRMGSWFTSNDATRGAEQTPAATTAYPTDAVGIDGSYGFASTANGYEVWGANFGVSLNDNGGSGCAYDASAFTGIEFCIMTGDDSTVEVSVTIPIPAIIPTTHGGTCVGTGCDDAHARNITVTGEWSCPQITWVELVQNTGWIHDNKYPFDSSNIAQIVFGVEGSTGMPANYNLIVDDLKFIGGEPGLGGETNQ